MQTSRICGSPSRHLRRSRTEADFAAEPESHIALHGEAGNRAVLGPQDVQSLRRNSIMLGSSRHLFLILRLPPPGSQAARALAFVARSVSA